jgi:hypothetical protein
MIINQQPSGLGDINEVINSIASGITKIGTAVISNSNDPYYSGKYQLPAIELPQTASTGMSKSMLYTLLAIGGAAVIGTIVFIKTKR